MSTNPRNAHYQPRVGGFSALSHVDFTLRGGSVPRMHSRARTVQEKIDPDGGVVWHADHYEGEIAINNQPVSIRTPRDAKQLGIHLVQQEVDVALIPGLSIAENIMLDRLAEQTWHWGEVRKLAQDAALCRWMSLDVRRSIDTCTLAEKRQITRTCGVSSLPLLILDEPTAPPRSTRERAPVHRGATSATAGHRRGVYLPPHP